MRISYFSLVLACLVPLFLIVSADNDAEGATLKTFQEAIDQEEDRDVFPIYLHFAPGKRQQGGSFNPWGGKRSEAFNPWGGKRSEAFSPWSGKRSDEIPAPFLFDGEVGYSMDKRNAFNPWGKRKSAEMSRTQKNDPKKPFNPWEGR